MARFKEAKQPLLFRALGVIWSLSKFTFWLFIALVLLIKLSETGQSAKFKAAGENPDFKQIADLLDAGHEAPALAFTKQLLASTTAFSSLERCWLLQTQGEIYLKRRHHHLAREAADSCLALDIADNHRYEVLQWRNDIQQRIDSHQPERYLFKSYVNLRESGFAKQMQGEIVVLYIYLEDNLWQGWSGAQRYMMQQYMEQATLWYQQQAQVFQQPPPKFDVHYYYVQTGRGISANWLRSEQFFADAAPLLLEQMGFRSWQQMHNLMTGNGKKQLAVIFHSNLEARSFASSCPKQSTDCKIEYVMLTEESLVANRWLVPQVQAHEMAHLFGAADLYNISAAKDYASTDLMNYLSAELQYAEIAPITAWAIGWGPKPTAPFELEE